MTRTMQSVWQALTNTMIPAAKLLMDGRWRTPSDGATMASVNPAIGAEITRILCGTAADIAQLAAVVPRRLGQGVGNVGDKLYEYAAEDRLQ